MQALMRPPAGMDFDFSQPAGEPALAPQDGVSWRLFANPVSLFVGGVTAVLLQLAEPSVRSGVWDHSTFQRDPATRLRRTSFAAMMTVYGPRSATEALIARVVRMHGHVQGTTPDGTAYHANDPRLLDWVQATATFSFAEAYHRYVRPLSPAEKDAAFAEGDLRPALWRDRRAILLGRMGSLAGSDRARARGIGHSHRFHADNGEAPILPAQMRWLQRLLVRAAVEMTPEPVRSLPQLRGHGLRFGEAMLVRALGWAVALLPMGDMPPAQAARRLATVDGKK